MARGRLEGCGKIPLPVIPSAARNLLLLAAGTKADSSSPPAPQNDGSKSFRQPVRAFLNWVALGSGQRVWEVERKMNADRPWTVWAPRALCRAGNPRSGVAVAWARPKGGMVDGRFKIQDRVAAGRPNRRCTGTRPGCGKLKIPGIIIFFTKRTQS